MLMPSKTTLGVAVQRVDSRWRCCSSHRFAALLTVPSSLLVEDLETNEGSPSRPYFVTPTLMNVLVERDKIKKQ